MPKKMKWNKNKVGCIYGPVSIGKTTSLWRYLQSCAQSDMKVLALKHTEDNRYHNGNVIITHDGKKYDDSIQGVTIAKYNLDQVHNWLKNKNIDFFKSYSVVGIDEAQFLSNSNESNEEILTNFVKFLHFECNLSVIIATIDIWYQGHDVKVISHLKKNMKLDFYERPYHLCVLCNSDEAIYSLRVKYDAGENSTELKKVGGTDIYKASCEECFRKNMYLVPSNH